MYETEMSGNGGRSDGQSTVAAAATVLRRRVASRDMWIDVTGESMLPTVWPPASVLVTTARTPRWGEVWAFVDHEGSIVVHRYLRRRRDGSLAFRGDGLAHEDWSVRPFQLVGQVVRVDDQQGNRPIHRRYRPVFRAFASALRRRAVALARRTPS